MNKCLQWGYASKDTSPGNNRRHIITPRILPRFPTISEMFRLIMASYWYHLKSLFVLKYSDNCGSCNGWNSIFNHNRHLHVGQYTYSIFDHNRHLHVGQCMYSNIYNTTPSKRLGTTSWWRWFHSYTCTFGKMFASHQHFLSKQ